MSDRKPIVGGNWKMNTDLQSASDLVRGVVDALSASPHAAEVMVFPPHPYLLGVRGILRDRGATVTLGAQDIYPEANGAFTGGVSASMLADCGVETVLAGHSERRHVMGEDDALVNRKALASLRGGMRCMLCVGETLEQREAGETDAVNERQIRSGLADVSEEELERVVIAYEPVWAIGTGRTSSPEDAQDAHARIRDVVESMFSAGAAERVRIVYGGSVKPQNAGSLLGMPDIDGGLIGGASLKAVDFVEIVRAAG